MATLAHRISKHQVRISSQCLVGQSPDSCVRLSTSAISAHHARISWLDDSYWVVRDLGSDRGTYLNGARLDSGNDTRLARGDTLRFGSGSEEFNLIDATAPQLSARRLTDHVLVEAEGDELCLPSRMFPEVRVYRDDGGWAMVRHGRRQPVQNAELIVAGAEIYRLSLPCSASAGARVAPPSIADVEFEFRVSSDEEHVEVWLHRPDGQTDILPARAHYYTLLVLARARLGDRDEELPHEARGWRSSPELSRMLAVDESSINVHVHRIRKELEGLGFADASAIISRQRARRLVRINSRRLVVRPGG